MISIFAMYLAVGAVAGILAGLLGIGGGLVIVPMLFFCFSRQGIPGDAIMHLALGTSMASIMFTAVSSFWSHHRRGAVKWIVVRRIVLGMGDLRRAWAWLLARGARLRRPAPEGERALGSLFAARDRVREWRTGAQLPAQKAQARREEQAPRPPPPSDEAPGVPAAGDEARAEGAAPGDTVDTLERLRRAKRRARE